MTDLLGLTMRAASEAVRTSAVSPVALVDAYLERIASVDSHIGSYILVLAAEARAAAKRAEAEIAAGRWRGPLHGLPFAVKDNYDTRGIRTCANSRLMMDVIPDRDATVVSRLAAAGAILLGKLNTWEYGTSMGAVYEDLPYPQARNPWDRTRLTGGSSTGAGASVPARTAMFALGSDTGGSVRLPAAACGLQGLKPTFGLVSRHGMLPNCWAFDTVGPLCWNVWDCAVILQAIAGKDPLDPASAGDIDDYTGTIADGVAGLTIGVILDGDCDGVHPDPAILAGLEAAAAMFEAAGARLKPVTMPASFIRYRLAASVINWAESFAIHERDFRDRAALMGQALRDKMMAGLSLPAVDYIAALRDRRVLTEMNAALMSEVDLLLCPGAFHVAPSADDAERITAFTADTAMTPFNMSGHPAITLCSGFDGDGLPTNIQLVGQWFGEAALLRAAYAYEQATPWRARFPEVT
ncbi:amidase [Acidisoma cellulosilytica]|uniref:Amidase n=1 Tax=Acidisoma cellulosilyticum TaxID=2802395 RepID=A0A964E5J4_9PROT|nr:amidase [Acidisoma cellulosilyticum]MCB8882584.1 amidase [Acidisoma cellulosilyticum]